MSEFCINRNGEEYKELNEILGSSELAHLVWDRNKGNMLDLAPDGTPSLLFKDLLELTDNDRFEAIRLKAQYYLENNSFGRWWGGEPELQSGFIRLYRAESKDSGNKGPDWLQSQPEIISAKEAKGRWFYRTRSEAEEHLSKFEPEGTLMYVDIPENDIDKYNAKDNKFAGGYGRQGNEYFLPKNIADSRKPVVLSGYKQEPRLDVKRYKYFKDSQLSVSIATSILDRLANKFGYKWVFDTSMAPGYGGQIDTAKDGSLIVKINPLSMQFETPFHEYAHILIAGLQKDNPELYNRLVEEIHTSREGKEALRQVYDKYDLEGNPANVEAIARLLGKYAADVIDHNTGLYKVISEAWEYIKKQVLSIFGIANVATLNPSITLHKLANLIADSDTTFDFGNTVFTEDQIVRLANYNKLFEKQSKPGNTRQSLTSEEIKNKILEHSKQFEFETDETIAKQRGHYKFKKDNVYEYLEGVTRRCARYGHGFVGGGETINTKIGKTIHGAVENIAKDVVADLSNKHGITLNRQARKDIEKIFKDLKGNYTALSEVVLGDVEAGLAGVIDLILISEDGKVMLIDFKTKVRNKYIGYDGEEKLFNSRFSNWDKPYGGAKYSQKDNTHLQLSIYAAMLEKVLDVNVFSIAVVKLDAIQSGVYSNKKYKVNDETLVESIQVYSESEDSISEPFWNDKGDIAYHNATRRIYEGDSAYLHNKTLENTTRIEKEKSEFRFSKLVTESEGKAGEILTKLKEELQSRINLARRRFNAGERAGLETLVERLEETESVTEALEWIILNASEEINSLQEELNNYINKGKEFTPSILYRWKDAVQAYKSLSKLKNQMHQTPEIVPNKKYKDQLNHVVDMVGVIEDMYKEHGRYLIAKWLTPYYNEVKVKYKDIYEAEYRVLKLKEVKRGKKSLDEFEKEFGDIKTYVANRLDPIKKKIDNETYDMLYRELEVASKDIGEMTRWIDNMLDTSDPVSAALVNAFMQAEEKARIDSINKKYDLIDAVEELQKHHTKQTFQSEESFYAFMLERDPETGKFTQHLLKPYLTKFWDDINEIKREEKLSKTKEEIAAVIKEFKKENRNWLGEEFDQASREFVLDMYKNNKITKEEFEIIVDYIQLGSVFELQRLGKLEGVREQVIGDISFWIGKNINLFFEYSDKYTNPQWKELMKLCGIDPNISLYYQYQQLKKSDNPYAKFYTFIENMITEADQMLPNGYRLHDRLPGIIKLNSERLKSGQSPLSIAKATFDTNLFVRPEDIERGSQEKTDEFGRVKYFIPINFTARVEPDYQSYDIPGIYFKFWESCNNYKHKRQILPEVEMTRFFVNERKAIKRNVFKDVLAKNTSEDDDKEPIYKDKTAVAEMLNDWLDMAMYGKYTKDERLLTSLSKNKSVDLMKFIDLINRYTSLNLLGGNVVQGFANVLVGEVMQAIGNIAGEYVSPKSYSKATGLYTYYLPQVMGDVTRNAPTSFAGQLFQEFNVLNESIEETMFTTNTRAGRFARNTSIYFVQHAGEHWIQNRFLLAMLIEKKAYDKQGNLLGSMLDQYELKEGKLKLKDNVDLKKSEWTENDQLAFKIKVKGILSRMHGEYSDLGRVAIQRTALGRMAYMFRKFVVPGFRRRWSSRRYIERLGQYTEGNYVTTIRFFRQYWKELATLQFSVMSENWAALSDHEKANIHRTISEAAFIIGAIILANLFLGMGDDDEDQTWLASFMSYQFLRLRAELLFFSPKLDEAWSILRSPMASMSVLQNIIDLTGQLTDPLEVYERGPWKGQLKLKKIALDFIPIYKQIYKARDIEQQQSWFKN